MAIFKVYKSSLMFYTLYYIDCSYTKSSFSKEIAMLSDFFSYSRIVAEYNKSRKNIIKYIYLLHFLENKFCNYVRIAGLFTDLKFYNCSLE